MEDFEKEYKMDALNEVQDNLTNFNDIIRELELGNQDSGVCHELFRLIHNIKGNSKSAGFDAISSLAHELENKLLPFRENGKKFTDKEIKILGSCYSALQDGVEKLTLNLNSLLDFSTLKSEISEFGEEEVIVDDKTEAFLVVDDEVEMTNMIEEHLVEVFDCNVKKVFNGKNAMELCLTKKFDIIITDYNMPLLNGQDFISQLRKGDSVNKDTPIIFVSGYRPDLVPDNGVWENVFILDKPFNPDKLTFLIKCSKKLKKSA